MKWCIDKVNCNRIQATSTGTTKISRFNNYMKRIKKHTQTEQQQNNFNRGYQKANIYRIVFCCLLKLKPAKKADNSNRIYTEKHEGGIFIVFCHIIATHIATVFRQFCALSFSFLLLPALSAYWLLIFAENVVSTFQSFVCYLSYFLSCSFPFQFA